MKQQAAREAAEAFLKDYVDREIDKRLYFAVWADRQRLDAADARRVWQEVRRVAYRGAARRREQVRRSNATEARRSAPAASRQGARPKRGPERLRGA